MTGYDAGDTVTVQAFTRGGPAPRQRLRLTMGAREIHRGYLELVGVQVDTDGTELGRIRRWVRTDQVEPVPQGTDSTA
ncbi:hypothetical protein [Plantactinospora soyae]|uniref:Uncharacterized protein n=1 Tax=Plantactinospora soyae TaxID=1544732 RepID=A0A927R4U0_9ACTN|nr:hypothetical protein [Plantactinospora soyae]MBE1485296.1 hypothetical protein [Plantactinospora soyae]